MLQTRPCPATYVRWQRGTARIRRRCCSESCSGDRYLLPAGPQQQSLQTGGQTDGHRTVSRPCCAYYADSANKYQLSQAEVDVHCDKLAEVVWSTVDRSLTDDGLQFITLIVHLCRTNSTTRREDRRGVAKLLQSRVWYRVPVGNGSYDRVALLHNVRYLDRTVHAKN